MMDRGWTGIGIFGSKFPTNIGTLVRSARCFGVDFVFTIGARYEKGAPAVGHDDHIPVFNYDEWFGGAEESLPGDGQVVCVENGKSSTDLRRFNHPERAIYLLGAEDTGLPDEITDEYPIVHIESDWCLNVAQAGTLALYDRTMHSTPKGVKVPEDSMSLLDG